MKKFFAMCIGLICTLLAINWWAGTFAPKIPKSERLIMDNTFYDQNTQLNQVFKSINQTGGIKVLGIGDSTMYGAIVHANQTIPYYLRQQLQSKNQSIHVYNLAFPGARPSDLYAMLKLAKQTNPDLVIIDVNMVFFAERVLHESALANQSFKREFLFDSVVPQGIFKENRLEEIVTTLFQQTNIGQYKDLINQKLFHQPPRQYVDDWAKNVQTSHVAAMQAPENIANPVLQQEQIIGKSWKQRIWDKKEQKVMARIYDQGPLTASNDSVRMLKAMIQYSKANHIKTLFYLTPQNDTLIGKFFSLPQLHQNENYLIHLMQQEGAWFVDLRNTVPADDFGDYDHMLSSGNDIIAQEVAKAIAQEGGISR